MAEKPEPIKLTAQIVASFVSNNTVSAPDLPGVIKTIHAALTTVDAGVQEPKAKDNPKQTAAAIRKSITPDKLISFIDGKGYATLKRHLRTQGMSLEDYKTRFGLPADYPSTAPAYSERRSAMAKRMGLGQGGRTPGGKAPRKPAKA